MVTIHSPLGGKTTAEAIVRQPVLMIKESLKYNLLVGLVRTFLVLAFASH
jgi:hypothetical protein